MFPVRFEIRTQGKPGEPVSGGLVRAAEPNAAHHAIAALSGADLLVYPTAMARFGTSSSIMPL